MFRMFSDRSEFFLSSLTEHLAMTEIAIIITLILGVSLGILITYKRKLTGIILSIINFAYTIPSIALFGILISVTGIGLKTAIIAIVIYALLPITRNVYVGLSEVDESIIEAGDAMGSTKLQMLFKIRMPLALPIMMAGFRTMTVMIISLSAIGEFIAAGGLGAPIWTGLNTNNTVMIAAGSILVALLAITADIILGIIEKMITRKIFGKKVSS